MENIAQHTFTLARYTYATLSSLRYSNGAPVVQIYSDSEFSSPEVQGPIINFNVLDDSGNIIGYSEVGLLFLQMNRIALFWNLKILLSLEICSGGLYTPGNSWDEVQILLGSPNPCSPSLYLSIIQF